MFLRKIGVDLGTANTLVYVPKKGVILNEPSVVAISMVENRILAVGNDAKEMIGRTPDTIVASRPMKDGVIADYRITEAMLRYFINKAGGRFRFFRPEVMVSVPAGITSTERRAVVDATIQAGSKAAYVVKQPVLAAIGAGIPINSPSGNMIIDIGGGTAQVAVISLGGIVGATSVRVAGDKIDQAIADQLFEIGRAVKTVLHETPPELSADVIDKGMVMSGGTSLLRNLDELLTQATGVPAYVAEDPLLCVAKGAGIALDNLDAYKRSILSKK